ncbi:S8 family serine peptidase [Nocardia sp. NBC_01009]|uniref:S8 family serine peptidase n=1 Tax=Nocardia sp. NBC_01009 TaxID=2975996 RepID=UPI003864B472|nr:S8 family serine peptidase [Nocardia sp. NBC_01009]
MALTPIPDLGDLLLVALQDAQQATPEHAIDLIEAMPEFHPSAEDLQPDPARANLLRWQSRVYSARRYLGDEGFVLSNRHQWRITESGKGAAQEARRRLTNPDLPSVTQSPDQRNPIQPSVITRPLLDPDVRARVLDQPSDDSEPLSVVIELNVGYLGGVKAATAALTRLLDQLNHGERRPAAVELFDEYVRAKMTMEQVKRLVEIDHEQRQNNHGQNVIHRIWPNFPVKPLIDVSGRTVKADAARRSFDACGRGIRWAVVDSGIDRTHPHFDAGKTVLADDVFPLHRDFTQSVNPGPETADAALQDGLGHGTHVAGIIAGYLSNSFPGENLRVVTEQYTELNARPLRGVRQVEPAAVSGMAPQAHLVSLKVLGSEGTSDMISVMAALRYVREVNGDNDRITKIHGVNISLGYEFDAEWFACGQSPLCKEVDRLVRSGVVVVVAAGNTGYGRFSARERQTNVGLTMTINDPGNAKRAITVGSTHRESPHTYGVSYFSSKGPTGDGRLKPDLVAPGERITSCATGKAAAKWGITDIPPGVACYGADTGTSFAAPHVSGAIAAFLSVRPEFITQAEEIKEIFVKSAVPLGRERYFEGAGLVDLMRALQSV